MNNRTFYQVQTIELRRLLDAAQGDPILTPQLRERLEDAEQAFAREQEQASTQWAPLPRTAIFMRGGGVQGSEGIRPTLAGEALIRYEKMFTEQALHFEREIAQSAGLSRRPAGSPRPGLLFTGTPRGSFGLEFVPQETDDPALREVRARALNTVTDALARVASSGAETHEEAIRGIPPSVLQPMKLFMKTLAQHGAELRLARHNSPPSAISMDQISAVVDRLDREVEQEEVRREGEFRGVTLLSGHFDFLTQEGERITGRVGGDLSEADLMRIHQLTNRQCAAVLLKTVIRLVSGHQTTDYVLLNAVETSVAPPPVAGGRESS